MKRIFLIGLQLLAVFAGKAQTNAGIEIVSVDPFTGTGSVGIPIHSIDADGLDVGVFLSYNGKGITVDEMSSQVGLGWSLAAGGSITREARGVEDEACIPAKFTNTINYTLTMDDTLQGMLVPGGLYHPGPTSSADVKFDDTEPDIYTLSLGTRTVRFAYKYNYPNPTYIYATDPKSELKIELFTKDYVSGQYTNVRSGVVKHMSEDSMLNILSFVVTDERGNKFFFERGDYERKRYEIKKTNTTDTGYYYPTQKWNLHRIKTATGREYKFTYVSKYVEQVQARQETSLSNYDHNGFYLYVKDIVWKGWKTHIAQIDYPGNMQVVFDLDTTINGRCDCQGDYKLKNIIVRSAHDASYKNSTTYRFNYAYFNSPTANLSPVELPVPSLCSNLGQGSWSFAPGTSQGVKDEALNELLRLGSRLKLKSIDRIGTDNSTTKRYYSFDYDATPLPYRLSPSKDYYGYHNGKTSVPRTGYNGVDLTGNTYGTYYLSVPYNGIYNVGVDKSFDFSYAKSFVLNKIENGLGGITDITYSNYQLVNPDSSYGDITLHPSPSVPIHYTIDWKLEGDTANDGLVVSKIAVSDRFNQEANSATEYTYKNGKRFNRGGYTSYDNDPSLTTFTSGFLSPPSFLNGSNHGFDTTIVTMKGYNNEWIATTKMTFSNIMYDSAGQRYSAIRLATGDNYHFASADFRKFRVGLPLRTDQYDEYGNLTTTQIKTYKFITHPVEILATGFTRVIRDVYTLVTDAPGVTPWIHHVLGHETALQDTVTNIRYEKDVPNATVKAFETSYIYSYDQHNNLHSVNWKDSKGNIFKKYSRYNHHYTYLAGISDYTDVQRMTDSSLQYLLSTEVWKQVGNDSVLLTYSLNTPKYTNSEGVITFPDAYVSAVSEPVSSSLAFDPLYINRKLALGFSTLDPLGAYWQHAKHVTRADSRHFEIESAIPNENIYQAKVIDTSIGRPVADVNNAKYEDVAYSSFEEIPDANNLSTHAFGNWTYDASYTMPYSSVAGLQQQLTGRFVYKLNASVNSILSEPLNIKPYILSFWAHAPSTAGLTITCSSIGTLTPVLRRTVGQWKLYTVEFTPASSLSQVAIFNQGGASPVPAAYVDEVRLYPVGATMASNTYKPLFGIGSSCDANNNIVYFEYDAFGAAVITRDIYGNIKTKTENVNQQSVSSPAPVPQTTY